MEEKQIHEEQSVNNLPKKRRKLPEPGVIYLSKIPALMNVKTIRDIFSQYGEIGKIFLQPNGKLQQPTNVSRVGVGVVGRCNTRTCMLQTNCMLIYPG